MTKKLILETLDDVKWLARMLWIQLQMLACDLRLFQLKEQEFFLNRKIDVAYAKLTGDTAEVFRLQLFRLMMVLFKLQILSSWQSGCRCFCAGLQDIIFIRCTENCWNVHTRLLCFWYFPFQRY